MPKNGGLIEKKNLKAKEHYIPQVMLSLIHRKDVDGKISVTLEYLEQKLEVLRTLYQFEGPRHQARCTLVIITNKLLSANVIKKFTY